MILVSLQDRIDGFAIGGDRLSPFRVVVGRKRETGRGGESRGARGGKGEGSGEGEVGVVPQASCGGLGGSCI